ncbi:MAG: ABC transporter ATP-binding protein [Cycloclasticus sp. symbiont of Poecilosclerida sp. M]|nr:MAG: ABC transporter ATP-binding protein [Cycloclasticus sp. symbiont of Poecilosclerida sp. M]
MSQTGGFSLQVEALSYAYDEKRALNNVNFSLQPKDCTILLGPNGAGKTTLFSLITHLYSAREGRVLINGYDVKKQPSLALANLGVVFQQTTLDLDLSVLQNLKYHASLHGMGRKQTVARIQQELERQGMYERRNEQVKLLNGGHRRRVEIARALLHQPSILLLDEPTVGLDMPSRKGIVEHVHSLCKDDNLSVLWATHLFDEAYETDQLVVLHAGEVKANGSVKEVCEQQSANDIAAAFQQLTAKKAS